MMLFFLTVIKHFIYYFFQSRAMIIEALRPHCALPGELPLSSPPANIVDDDAAPELARDGGGEAPADRQNLITVCDFDDKSSNFYNIIVSCVI